ncbi:MAG: hypothetical protein E6G47_07795 [Actinobacteria bacterium]|nr:MAG: hypothetical protein E6G47_07795 [Actinomycetota bacterium]
MLPPKSPTFALDENFPQPILREAIAKYVLGIDLVPLVDVDPKLLGAYQDDELVAELATLGIQGLVTCDDNMIFRSEVLDAIERTRFSVVTGRRVGDDPVRASGLLLIHLPDVAKRYSPKRAQIWRLGTVESQPLDFADHAKRVRGRAR